MADNKLNEADVLSQLATANAELTTIKATGKTAAVLISEHGALTADVAKLTGDKTKLVAGATLPTDLVSAANTISTQAAEIATLKGNAMTLEQAVAKEVARLGIIPGKTDAVKPANGTKLSLDEEAANFLKSNPGYQTTPFSKPATVTK